MCLVNYASLCSVFRDVKKLFCGQLLVNNAVKPHVTWCSLVKHRGVKNRDFMRFFCAFTQRHDTSKWDFIEKIVVHAPKYLDGKRYQLIDVYFYGVGIIKELTPEEMETEYQKLAKQEKSA